MDYFLIPHDSLKFCSDFTVDLMSDILESNGLYNMISDKCKAPDHSLLTLQFNATYADSMHSGGDTDDIKTGQSFKRYYFNEGQNDFLCSETWRLAVFEIIQKLEDANACQNEIDNIYSVLCQSVFKELDEHVNFKVIDSKKKENLRTQNLIGIMNFQVYGKT